MSITAEPRLSPAQVEAYRTRGYLKGFRIFSDAEVDRALRFHVPVKIDIDDQPVLAKMYKVESIPFFAILDGDGEIESSASGKMTSQELIAWVKRASKQGMAW